MLEEYDNFGNNVTGLKPDSGDFNAAENFEPPQGLVSNPVESPTNPNSILSGSLNSELNLVGGHLQSSNFVAGSTGWQIKSNGDV